MALMDSGQLVADFDPTCDKKVIDQPKLKLRAEPLSATEVDNLVTDTLAELRRETDRLLGDDGRRYREFIERRKPQSGVLTPTIK